MNHQKPQDTQGELEYQARQAAELGAVHATPPETMRRYREHKDWRLFVKEYLFHCIERAAPRRICNLGCGAGETCTELAHIGYHVTGFDLSPELIALAVRRAELDRVTDRATFLVADALKLETVPEPFDLVLVQAALHHMEVPVVLDALDRLLKPGGTLVIQEPVAFLPWLQRLRNRTSVSRDFSPNERPLNQTDLAQIEARFDVVEKRFYNLFARFLRFVPDLAWVNHQRAVPLRWLDHLLTTHLPFTRRFAGVMVAVYRKRR